MKIKKLNRKVAVGILGATGVVGQKLISLLQGHPWFEVKELVASPRSVDFKYQDLVNWRESQSLPLKIGNLRLKKGGDNLKSKLLFSCLDSTVADSLEKHYADQGHFVISNASNHRLVESVPLVVPEINADHFGLLRKSSGRSGGLIVTNPNCVVAILAMSLSPIFKNFGLKNIIVNTMQSASGAGYPGVSAMDLLGNVLPYIGGEEEKISEELPKIFGKLTQTKIELAKFKTSVTCYRVPVYQGHLMTVAFTTSKRASIAQLKQSFEEFKSVNLPSSPSKTIKYFEDDDRPQPLLDVSLGGGMTVAVGRLRQCEVLGWKMVVLGNNLVRGAAGGAILNAEYLLANNLISSSFVG